MSNIPKRHQVPELPTDEEIKKLLQLAKADTKHPEYYEVLKEQYLTGKRLSVILLKYQNVEVQKYQKWVKSKSMQNLNKPIHTHSISKRGRVNLHTSNVKEPIKE